MTPTSQFIIKWSHERNLSRARKGDRKWCRDHGELIPTWFVLLTFLACFWIELITTSPRMASQVNMNILAYMCISLVIICSWPNSQCTAPWQRLFSRFLNIPQCLWILCAGLGGLWSFLSTLTIYWFRHAMLSRIYNESVLFQSHRCWITGFHQYDWFLGL